MGFWQSYPQDAYSNQYFNYPLIFIDESLPIFEYVLVSLHNEKTGLGCNLAIQSQTCLEMLLALFQIASSRKSQSFDDILYHP